MLKIKLKHIKKEIKLGNKEKEGLENKLAKGN